MEEERNKDIRQKGIFNIGTIDKKKIINYYGINEKDFEEMCQRMQNAIIASNSALQDKNEQIMALVEDKIIAHILDISQKQNESEANIKASINSNFESLKADNRAFQNNLIKEVKDNIDRIEKFCHECTYQLEGVYEELLLLGKIIGRMDVIKDKELRVAKKCLKEAKFDDAKRYFNEAKADRELKSDAYFGMALADCKIQLLWDYNHDCEQAICHDYKIKTIRNTDFDFAIGNGSNEQITAYEKIAKSIEKTLSYYDGYTKNMVKYDCFVCIKESISSSDEKKTDDFIWMKKNFDQLIKLINKDENRRELKVFFSAIDCADLVGEAYEALVLYALKEAKCMLLVCSDESYLDTDWVKNEYTRFRSFWASKGLEDKQILIVYKGKRVNIPGREDLQDINRGDIEGRGVTDTDKERWFEQLAKNIRKIVDNGEEYISPYSRFCPKCGEEYKNPDSTQCQRCPNTALINFEDYINGKYKEEKERNRRIEEELSNEKNKAESLRNKLNAEQSKAQEAETLKKALINKVRGKEISRDEEYIRGLDTDPDQIRELRERANSGDVEAQFALAEIYLKGAILDGRRFDSDHMQAAYWYEKAADNGHTEAQYKFGHMVIYDKLWIFRYKRWVDKGNKYLIDLAESNHLRAQYSLANYYSGREPKSWDKLEEFESGLGPNKDIARAIELLKEITKPIDFVESYSPTNDEDAIRLKAYYLLGTLTESKKESKEIIGKAAKLGAFSAQEKIDSPYWLVPYISLIAVALTFFVGMFTYWFGGDMRRVLHTVQNGFLIFSWILCLLIVLVSFGLTLWWIIVRLRYKIKLWSGVLISVISIGISAICAIYPIVHTEIRSSFYNYDINADNTLTVYLDGDFKDKKKLEIPATIDGYEVSAIGGNAFSGCENLEKLVIPSCVTRIDNNAFNKCSSLEYNEYDNGLYLGNKENPYVVLVKAKSTNITSCIINENTRVICYKAFSKCSDLMSIEIPNSVVSIGNSAFSDCSKLQYNLYDNGLYLGNKENPYLVLIKAENNNITRCNINDNASIIYDSAFKGCSSLISIEIPSSIKSIGGAAFAYCSSLESVNISSSVVTISKNAFMGCDNLSNLIVEVNNTKYKSEGNCIIEKKSNTLVLGIKNSVIPSSVTNIGDYAFFGCSSLTSIEIPSSVISIGERAFSNCYGLRIIELPSSVTNIGDYAFSGCSSLTSIKIPSRVKSIGDGVFSACFNLTSIELPSSVTSIGEYAFSSCSNLTSIEIPSRLTSIGNYAFNDCSSLTRITIPSRVKSMGFYAFKGCSNLTIYCEAKSVPRSEYPLYWSDYWNPDNRTVVWGYKPE